MRTLATLLAVCTALLGGACAYLLWHAGDQRSQAQDERALQRRIESLVAERERLRGEIELARRSSPCVPPPSSTPVRADNVAGSAGGAIPGARGGPGRLFENLSPEHRRTMVRERYGRLLYQELSLSDAEVDALLPVLVAQDEGPGGPAANFGPRDTPEAREREREIAAVIGAERAAQFAEARSTIPARVQVRTIREDLERAGAPLSDAQNTALLQAVQAARVYKQPPFPPGGAPNDMFEQMRAWRAERAKHLREVTAPVLTPLQLQRLDEYESMRAAMQMLPPGALGPGSVVPVAPSVGRAAKH